MKIKLLDWRDESHKQKPNEGEEISRYLLKMEYVGLEELALEIDSRTNKPIGLIPPYSLDHLSYTFSCMSTVRDHFPHFPVYAAIPKWCSREAIRSVKTAGFRHFILQFVDPWAFEHQAVHDLLKDARGVHVAGGDPKIEGWTWSEEML